jgi:hypothetical protein
MTCQDITMNTVSTDNFYTVSTFEKRPTGFNEAVVNSKSLIQNSQLEPDSTIYFRANGLRKLTEAEHTRVFEHRIAEKSKLDGQDGSFQSDSDIMSQNMVGYTARIDAWATPPILQSMAGFTYAVHQFKAAYKSLLGYSSPEPLNLNPNTYGDIVSFYYETATGIKNDAYHSIGDTAEVKEETQPLIKAAEKLLEYRDEKDLISYIDTIKDKTIHLTALLEQMKIKKDAEAAKEAEQWNAQWG